MLRVSARSCKLANTTHLSSTPPLDSLQGFRSYGCLSYFTYTMDRKKKLKASKPVWRPISTHSSSQEGCLTNGEEVGSGSSPTEVANDKSEVQVEVASDVQNVTKNSELGSEVAELSGSRTTNIEEEQVAASAYANVEAGNRVKQHSVSVEDRKKKLKTSKSVWRPISSSHEDCSADVVKLETGSSQADVANNEKSEAKVQVQAVTHARNFGKKDEITSEVVELSSSTVINVEEEQLTACADVNVKAVNTSNEARKHSVSIEVGASLICFVRGKGGSTQKQIEEETGAKLIFPSSKKESFIVIEGGSLESVTKASEKIQAILEEAVKSPTLDYSHFISLPLAIHPELVDKLINFQASVLGNSDSCKDENGGSESDGHSADSEDNEQQLDGALDVAVKLKVEDKNEHVIVEINKIPLVSYPPKASKSLAPPDLGIDRSIFIKPKTFHLTILMLKLWNKERIAAATEVLQRVYSKVMDALEGKPVFVKLNGLESMRGSLAKARVLYTPVEVIGGQDRLLRACKIIVDTYAEAGLVLEKDAQQKLKLHGTVMNARHRKRKKGTKRSDSFDARGIVKQYGSEEWGEYLIREAHLSQRFAFDENGYYHCCASLPLTENKQE